MKETKDCAQKRKVYVFPKADLNVSDEDLAKVRKEIKKVVSTLKKAGLNIDFSDVKRTSKACRNSNCAD